MSRDIKFSFMWQHQQTGQWMDKRYTLDQVIAGDPYEDFSDSPFLRKYHHVATREFTGLIDKGKVEIYEGDILETDSFCDGEYSVVLFNGRGCFVAAHPQDSEDWCLLDDYEFKVIGNVYENSDLTNKQD